MQTLLVKEGYDKIARAYLASRDRLKSSKYIYQLIKYLPKHSTILDLGCGAGVPVDDILIKAGHDVLGIDISIEQIKLARTNCPTGSYIAYDIANLTTGEYDVDAVVCFYTLFHLPRNEHKKLLAVIHSFIKKDGMLLITMGDREFEGNHNMYDVKMWSSQFGTSKNHKIIAEAGFEILLDEIDNSGGERHQIILARKK